MASPSVDLLRRDDIVLVFGMEWFPLLGSHPDAQARTLARRRRAAHRVVCSGGAAAVGLLRGGLPRKGGQRQCSAAAAFAALHPVGTVAAVLPFPGGRHWLVAVHEGAVMTHADQVFAGLSQLHDTLRVLREAHPGLVLHEENHPASGLLDALFETARERGALIRAARPAGGSAAVVSAALIFAIGFLASGLGPSSWHGAGRNEPVLPVDAAAAWSDAVAASARPHAVHGVAGLGALLDAVHEAPADLAGWRLIQIDCRPAKAHWSCRSRYRREGDSDNLDFLAAAHPHWTVSFDPMEGAEAGWSAPMSALPLGAVALHRPQHNEAWLMSALQAMLPAFSELRLEAPQALPLSAPLDEQRRPLPRPPEVAGYRRRALRVQAPLRSLGLLLPETVHVSWERFQLQIAPVDSPTLRSSSLRVSLSGVLYEIDDPHAASSFRPDALPRRG